MRTLKKTLSLVLALVMVLGMCTFFASAAISYEDKETITYKEAVDVLSGIGVLSGYEDGTFKPTANIRRDEAAKVIAYLLIGDAKAADALKVTKAPFEDVPATQWAAGYIAYCVERGVINGTGSGNFEPTRNVSGLEFAKMLLCAIGYGVNGEYTGDSWAINVAKDGVQYKVFKNNLAGATEDPATREECALYAFNTLELRKVTYSALYGGYIENTNAQNAESNKEATIANDYSLWKRAATNDAFGRPQGHYWVQYRSNNRISGNYGAEEWLAATFTTPVTGTMLYDVIGTKARSTYYTVYENGASYYGYDVYKTDKDGDYILDNKGDPIVDFHVDGTIETANNAPAKSEFAWLSTVARDNTKVLAHTGYGVTTEVYMITDDVSGLLDEIRIVIVHNYLGQVGNVKAATTLTDRYITINLPQDANYYFDPTLKLDNTYETEDFAKGDYVIFNYSESWGCIVDVKLAEVITSKITSWTNRAGGTTIGANGTTYSVAKDDNVQKNQTRASDIDYRKVNTVKFTMFADWNGNLYGLDTVTVKKDFVYVSSFGFRNTTAADDVSESQSLTFKYTDTDGNTAVAYLNPNCALPGYGFTYDDRDNDGKNDTDSKGNLIKYYALADAWAAANLKRGEQDVVDNLNNTLSQKLYYMSAAADGRYYLTDLEALAQSQDITETAAYGENWSTTSSSVFRGVTGLRNVKNVNATETNTANDAYELQASGDTVFFYLNISNPSKPVLTVYNGISNVPGGSQGKDGARAWYAEADTAKQGKAYAEVVLVVHGGDTVTADWDVPTYVYVDNGKNQYPGDYTKIDNDDGTWSVEFYVTTADGEEKTFKYDYASESKANAALLAAAAFVAVDPAAWVVDGSMVDGTNGLLLYVDADSERWNKNDSMFYLGASPITQAESTNDGITLFYTAKFVQVYEDDALRAMHDKGIELTDLDLVNDFTGQNFSSLEELLDYCNANPGTINVVAAFDADLVVKTIFLF